jgi:transketolase
MKKRFPYPELPEQEVQRINQLSRACRTDVLTMTTIANSGHPGGSFSAMEIFLIVYSYANISPETVDDPNRDKIVVSFGHTSPGIYSVLGRLGFFDLETAIATFRKAGSIFEGHVTRKVPGVEWGTGNLGQGLSAGCGFAVADRLMNRDCYTFVLMSDGEQAKGQVGEARRFAVKYGLNRLKVVIDFNRMQISGCLFDIMPQNIKENYLADGWEVIETDGHDVAKLYKAIADAVSIEKPVCVIASTVMGHGVSFMENKCVFHGKPLKPEEYEKAVQEIGQPAILSKYSAIRKSGAFNFPKRSLEISTHLSPGTPRTYEPGTKIDNRSAFGNALADIGKVNKDNTRNPVVVFDCDLATSVKTDLFAKEHPDRFFQVGVQEHNAATIAGAASIMGPVSFFADFGVFGVDETFNQERLNDQNHTNLKLVCTHLGLDVGEDGKTHQCIDYIGLLRNIFGFRLIIPADANQTDRATRFMAVNPGNYFLGMGRSVTPVITDENGKPFFGAAYTFEYGKCDILRAGKRAYIYTMGAMVPRAVRVADELKKEGIDVGVINCPCPLEIGHDYLQMGIDAGVIISYEDHIADTGLGLTIALALAGRPHNVKFHRFGVKNYGSSGTPDELYAEQGIDEKTVKEYIRRQVQKT